MCRGRSYEIPAESLVASRLLEAPSMLEVAIVSANAETLDGLSSYLGAAGIRARCTRRLDGCSRAEATRGFVFFPDDFHLERVVATIAELAARRPGTRPVVVTANPHAFARLAEDERVMIVPKPAWASAILDAVRASVEEPS